MIGRILKVPPSGGWKAARTRTLESVRYVAQLSSLRVGGAFQLRNGRPLAADLGGTFKMRPQRSKGASDTAPKIPSRTVCSADLQSISISGNRRGLRQLAPARVLLPRPTTKEWGEDRGEGWPPPLPGPLLHPVEERECRIAAQSRCALSRICNPLSAFMRGPADCKSAIQQITNLRYGGSVEMRRPANARALDKVWHRRPACGFWRRLVARSGPITGRDARSTRRRGRLRYFVNGPWEPPTAKAL